MDTSLKDQAKSKVTQAQNILIAVSKKSNLDGLASGLALYLALKKFNKNVTIIARAPTVSDARLLYGVGDIGKKIGSKNLVIGINNAVKNVDKVTYNLTGEMLKIIVHALPGAEGVKQEDITYSEIYGKADLLISIGYNSELDLNTEIEHELEIDSNLFIINISREKPNTKFAQIEIIDHYSPSISETVTGFSQLLALPIDEDIAFNLYTGIASATQMFSPKLARPETLSTAAWLLKYGAGKASLAQGQKIMHPEERLSSSVQTIMNTSQQDIVPRQKDSAQADSEIDTTPIEQVEREKQSQEDWLKPPKIYRGSKSFDIES
ncbi:MAG: DHH family/DHHA1 domain protein [Candidatus Curtissbacteria bacterium GW2011_GWA1_40_9]|uniref:DHH family/DHHA1 domain protein n=1 Tax=Candidatus Curtissbacteria bacterium GW2011_GWA1_40_9 TaxID=1618408 RepID=A0A0G0TLU7_9BACT|nr:MAG: DHH family/DHHA1 domain protein [Candidatus Curtissbacteria bacterium GW2011_GWA1_40_9]